MLDKDLPLPELCKKHGITPPPDRRKPDCPQCGSADTGTEVSEEWYCYSCGHQWMKVPHHPRT